MRAFVCAPVAVVLASSSFFCRCGGFLLSPPPAAPRSQVVASTASSAAATRWPQQHRRAPVRTAAAEEEEVEVEATAGRARGDEAKLLNTLKVGQLLVGRVVQSTEYAAFLECGVVRKAKGGTLASVTAFLHKTDIPHPYCLHSNDAERDSGVGGNSERVVINKGMHIPVYVKDIFKNQGRITVTLRQGLTKVEVMRDRTRKRRMAKISRRSMRPNTCKTVDDFPEGLEVKGVVARISSKGLLVDVGAPRYAKMPMGTIGAARGEFIEDLNTLPQPGSGVIGRVIKSDEDRAGMPVVRLEFVKVCEPPFERALDEEDDFDGVDSMMDDIMDDDTANDDDDDDEDADADV